MRDGIKSYRHASVIIPSSYLVAVDVKEMYQFSFRNLSASMAALHPEAAAQMAWR